jgi:hypothetical protein
MIIEATEVPRWKPVWRNESGRWWTTRETDLTRAQRDAGCAIHVSADTPDALDKLLGVHNELATLADALAQPARRKREMTS